MFRNYLTIAWRQMLKNKLYSAINILGLVVGLGIYIFGSLLVDYERHHDTFFKNYDRIFTAGSLFSATANIGVSETNGIYTALQPFIISDIDEMEEVARTVKSEFLMSIEDDHYYQVIRFADPALLKIFDFDYIEGDARALDDPSGMILTRSAATKFFGEGSALGKVVTLDHGVSLSVTAVIADLPANSHFGSSLVGSVEFKVIAPLAALNRINGYDLAGNFNNLSSDDNTYMLLPADKSLGWLQAKLDGVYESHFPENERDFVTGIRVRPLIEANTAIWDAIGMPILESVRLLALLVLVVAIVNYTNLATAQSLGRAKEVGLRKTMGADRRQLLTQFLVESLCIAVVSMLIALAALEILIPMFNAATNKNLIFDYANTLPWLLVTTAAVGLISGAYPAYLITHASPIDALRDGSPGSAGGSLFRSMMLGLQFSISIFMMAMVLIMYFQNDKIEKASNIYPKSAILTLHRLDVESIQARLETLRNELINIPGVTNVSYSSDLPYLQNNSSTTAGTIQGDESSSFMLKQIRVDENFLQTYDILLLAGRNLFSGIAADNVVSGVLAANVVVNELALHKFGFSSPTAALNQVYYDFPEEREPRVYTIVGVVPDQNFMGFHNKIKPTVFFMDPPSITYASVRVTGKEMAKVRTAVEKVWLDVIPDYPIQSEFLNDTFNNFFVVYSGLTRAFAGFAVVALSLSLIGLFGLAAFMAESKTKEIGIRKVMGASLGQIVRLLIWQFSRPVMWALFISLPLAYFVSDIYLNFFADRVSMPAGIIAIAGALSVVFAWAIVAIHAFKIARANPIRALRYE